MSARARAVAAMCQGKECLPHEIARKVARRMGRRHKLVFEEYKCPVCKEWHVGQKPDRKLRSANRKPHDKSKLRQV